MSLVGPKPKTVSVVIKVDTTALMRGLEQFKRSMELLSSRWRITLQPDGDLLALDAWENEGGAL